jgi:hypothetical protein
MKADSPRPLSLIREPVTPRAPERLKPLFGDTADRMTPERAADLMPWFLDLVRTTIESKDAKGTAQWCASELAALASLIEQWQLQWQQERRAVRPQG